MASVAHSTRHLSTSSPSLTGAVKYTMAEVFVKGGSALVSGYKGTARPGAPGRPRAMITVGSDSEH